MVRVPASSASVCYTASEVLLAHSETASEVRRAIGASLRRHRDAERRTLSAIAAEAGCSPAHLSEVERGRKDVSTELLVSIAYALRVPVGALYAEVSDSLAPAADGPMWPVDPRARLEMAAGQLSRDGLRAVAEFGTFMAMGGGEPPRQRIGFVPQLPR